MMDLLSLSVSEVLKPGVIALVSQEGMLCQVLHTRSIVKLLGRLIDELESNEYRNRVIQEKYNSRNLEIKLLGYVDLDDVVSINIKDLILRHKSLDYCKQMFEAGYTLLNGAPPVEFTVKSSIEGPKRNRCPQVKVSIARGTKYFVQKPFNSVSEAEAYINSTDVVQVLKDTLGYKSPMEHEVPLELRVNPKRVDRRKYNKGRPKKRGQVEDVVVEVASDT